MEYTQLGNVRLDADTAKMAQQLTDEDFGGNRSEMVREAIKQLFRQRHPSANLVLGYIGIERRGDLDEEAECPECGQDLVNPFLWFREDGSFGICCSACATSE